MHYNTEPLTLQVDRAYKADLTFETLPIESFDLILGSPWLIDNHAITNHRAKTVTLQHRGKKVVLHQQNPLKPLSEADSALLFTRLTSTDNPVKPQLSYQPSHHPTSTSALVQPSPGIQTQDPRQH